MIPVRAEERLDEAALAAWLRGRLPGAEAPLAVAQFGGGHANLTYLLRFGAGAGRRRVRAAPPAARSRRARRPRHAARVPRALGALARLPAGAPRLPLLRRRGADRRALRRDGAPSRRRGARRACPSATAAAATRRANRKLSEVVIDTLVELHAVDPKPLGLDALGRDPERFLERQLAGWLERYRRAQTRVLAEADELVAWLGAAPPAVAGADARSTTTGASTTWPSTPPTRGAAPPSTTGTCAPSAIPSPTSARCSRSGATAARRRPAPTRCPPRRRAS